jgi:hypothetical protein
MPYNVTLITVRPAIIGKAVTALESWLKANPRKGEFLACWTSEIGALNQVLLLHHYASDADLAADRESVLRTDNPLGIGEFIADMAMDSYSLFPFLGPVKPGQYGPVFEVRSYVLKPEGLPVTIERWQQALPARQKLSNMLCAMYSTSGAVTRFVHIWPYPDLNERARVRGEAVKTGVWPPSSGGGPSLLVSQRTDIFLPAAFSPVR